MTKLNLAVVSRSCHPCTACCLSKGVLELNKAGGTECVHTTVGTGCNIYSDRPKPCQIYSCAWLEHKTDFKPNICGFVLDLSREQSKGRPMWSATPAWLDAFKDEKVIYRLKKLVRELKQPVIAENHSLFLEKGLKYVNQVYAYFGTRDLVITWV